MPAISSGSLVGNSDASLSAWTCHPASIPLAGGMERIPGTKATGVPDGTAFLVEAAAPKGRSGGNDKGAPCPELPRTDKAEKCFASCELNRDPLAATSTYATCRPPLKTRFARRRRTRSPAYLARRVSSSPTPTRRSSSSSIPGAVPLSGFFFAKVKLKSLGKPKGVEAKAGRAGGRAACSLRENGHEIRLRC